MPLSSKYKVLDTLHENSSTLVYRATGRKDHKNYILKVLKPQSKNEHTLYEFINEQKILENIKLNKIIRLVEVISTPTDYIHVFEDIGGSSLFELMPIHNFTLLEQLSISLSLAKTLHILHKKFIIHADINPKNIIYNPHTKELQIIDFGHSILRKKSLFDAPIIEGSSGNLFYISPEQTGLTQQLLDHRSDLYSLGMSLYHLFLGETPFKAEDKEELLHKQIALIPKPLHLLNSKIPIVISKIISKLIEKNPQDRYQNDEALIHDLQTCLKHLNSRSELKDFEIASFDYPLEHIGEKLFGREVQMAVLKSIAENSSSSRILISGSSGVGKTRLVQEYFSYFSHKNTYIIEAKFEQFNDPIPYLIFKQLFKQILTILISQSQKINLSKLSAQHVSVLLFVFPELEEIFNSLPKKDKYFKDDLNLILPQAIQNLFLLLSNTINNLVVFIDDLQWADEASSRLLQESILNTKSQNLHFIAAYRDNEIMPDSNAAELIHELSSKKRYNCICLKLHSLNEAQVQEMIQVTFHQEGEKLHKLSTILYKKTNGNPFYLKTLIQHLIQEQDLAFEKGRWKYSLEKIQAHSSSINIISLINTKFSKLSHSQQRYLQHLSLLGNRYDLKITKEIMSTLSYNENILYELQAQGFIEQSKNQYLFVHDQIQKNVYNTLSEPIKRKFHKHISNFFQKQINRNNEVDCISYAYHLNNSYSPYSYPKKLFKINIIAVEETLTHHAYKNALEKIQWMQIYLFTQDMWKSDFNLSFKFSYLSSKVFYLNTLQEDAYIEIKKLLPKARNISDKLLCFSLLKDICVTKGEKFLELINTADVLLIQLHVTVPTQEQKSTSLLKLQSYIKKSSLYEYPSKILKLPRLYNPKKQQLLSLLVDYWEIAYYLTDVELMQWSILNIMKTSFQYGNTSESSFAYVLYGAQLASSQSYKKAEKFGNLALKLNHNINDKDMLPKIHNFMANFINPYTKPLSSNISLYQKSLHQSKLNGNLIFGTWANFLMHFSDFLSGHNLEDVLHNINKENSFLLNSGDVKMLSIFLVLKTSINSLQDNEINEEQEEEFIKLWQKDKFYPALAWYAIIKAQSCFFKNKIRQGLIYLSTYVHSSENEVIMFPKIRLHFIRALLLMAKEDKLNEQESISLEKDLNEFETYIQQSPSTFKFEKILLKAQKMKHKASIWDMAKLFDQSLEVARQQKNQFQLSVASLCASRYFEKLEFNDLYNFYTNISIVALNQWGAYGPAKHLKTSKYIELNSKKLLESSLPPSLSSTSKFISNSLNIKSLIKSFNAISKAQDNTELLHALMKTIVENATASKAVLIFKEHQNFNIKAQINFNKSEIKFYDVPYEKSDLIPKNLLSYVINTAQTLNLLNPSESGKFQFDTYFKKKAPASCLLIPSIIEGSVKALLYLENENIATPLNEETRKSLELLLTQAAIVFKNTSLFESIKKSEYKLTKAQEIAHVGSWQLNTKNKDVIWSAETYRIYELEPFSIKLTQEWFSQHLHPDDLEYITQASDKALAGHSTYDVQHRIITVKGNIKKVHQRAEVFLEDNILMMSGTIQDITQSEMDKEEISRLSQVVNQSPYTTIITDTQGYISYINKQGLIMSGYKREEVLGKKMNIFRSKLHSDSFYKQLWYTISKKREIWKGTIINKMKDGHLLDCQSTIFPIVNEKKELINFVTIQDDRTQENIKDKIFVKQTRQAQMGEMLSMIAHQWRQPLSIITAFINTQRVNIALDSVNIDEISKSYINIEQQVLHLSSTISDFSNFFKPDKESINTKSSLIINKSLSLIQHSLTQDNIKITINPLEDPSFRSFESELKQVILNLIKNAQDAFKEKTIEDPSIIITYTKIKDNAVIIIEDNAKGIDKELIDTLFLPYISTKSEKHGTGLGLYMSKTIVQEHCKGKIDVKNSPSGAVFTISIPLKEIHG